LVTVTDVGDIVQSKNTYTSLLKCKVILRCLEKLLHLATHFSTLNEILQPSLKKEGMCRGCHVACIIKQCICENRQLLPLTVLLLPLTVDVLLVLTYLNGCLS
ncbi:hypothetical protein GQX74_005482, partial [Glossina fuscipes]